MGRPDKGSAQEEFAMYVCICHTLSDQEIRKLAQEGASTEHEIFSRLQLKPQCGTCSCAIKELLQESFSIVRDNTEKLLDK